MPNPLLETLKKTTPEQMQTIFHNVFDTDNGQLVLAYLKTQAFYYGTTKSASPEDTAFNEGMRAVLLSIDAILNPIEDSVKPDEDSLTPE